MRYTDTRVRYVERFEGGSDRQDESNDRNPLLNRVAGDSELEPLHLLLAYEAMADSPAEPPSHESPASAFIALLRVYDNKMIKLAEYLLISLSYCYRYYAKARHLAICQHPLRPPMLASEEELTPRSWRRFRLICRKRDVIGTNEFQSELI